MSTATTDALELLREIYADLVQGAIPNADDPWWQKASAVLAKWGMPAGGEPFGYFHQLLNHEGKGNGVWLGAAERKVVEQAHTPGETSEEIVALYTAPQPTQTQAVALPLTGEYQALVCDYCGALTPDPWHSSGMLHGKMSKHIHSCDACAVLAKWGQPSGATEEVENLRKALVYAAFALHDAPQYMLAQGITLIDGDTVRVSRDGWTVEASVNPHRQPAPATQQAGEAWRARASHGQAPANPDPAYSAACNLATALFKKHFAHLPDFASGQAVWSLCDSTAGVLSQIDNMVSGLAQPPTISPKADSVQEDAALWHWLAEYLVGTRTDLDDEIVACETVNDLRKLVESAIEQGQP